MKSAYHPTEFAEHYPSGAFVLSMFMAGFINGADDAFEQGEEFPGPIEQWGDKEWKLCEKRLDAFIEDVRKHASAGGPVSAQGTALGHDRGEVLRRLRGMREYLRDLKFQATRDFSSLKRFLHVHRGEHGKIFIWIRDWLQRWEQSVERKVSKKNRPLLTEIFGVDFLHAASDELSREINKKIQQGDRAFTKRPEYDYPVAIGEIHKNRAEDKATFALQLAPHAEDWEIDFWRNEGVSKGESRLEIRASLAPDAREKLDRAMLAHASRMGDQDSDLMTFFMGRFAEKAKRIDDQIWVTLEELLEFTYTPNIGGKGGRSYRASDKAALRRRVEDLQRLDLTVHGLFQGKRFSDYQSRLFTIFQRKGQADLTGHISEWTDISIGFGRVYSQRIIGLEGRQRMQLQMQALRYSASNERFEKRLAKYFGPFWKINFNKHNKSLNIKGVAETIIDGLTEPVERFASKEDATRFEKALDRLKQDGIIADWEYAGGELRIDQQERLPKGWNDRWLERNIEVEIPEQVKQLYMELEPKNRTHTSHIVPVALSGEDVRRWREDQGINLPQLADALGINRGYLSRIETNKRPMTFEVQEKFRQYQNQLSKFRPPRVQ